jgi:DNA-binding MarR family transcriptional regulator
MSSESNPRLLASAREGPGPPFVGALLRLCHERVRARLDAAIRAAGFTDLQPTHMAVFSYPPPDGVRPSELARRIRMSRQATNHVIAQLEALGYLERRAIEGGERRLVFMTERAWRLIEPIFACLRDVEAEWAAEIGEERFREFKDVLRRFATEAPRL